MGLSEFTSKLGWCGFDYMWDWKKNSTFFGTQLFESITRRNTCAFVRMVSTVLYIQTWQCLSPYFYYNTSTALCQDECGLYFYESQEFVDI